MAHLSAPWVLYGPLLELPRFTREIEPKRSPSDNCACDCGRDRVLARAYNRARNNACNCADVRAYVFSSFCDRGCARFSHDTSECGTDDVINRLIDCTSERTCNCTCAGTYGPAHDCTHDWAVVNERLCKRARACAYNYD